MAPSGTPISPSDAARPAAVAADLAVGLVIALASGGATWWLAGVAASYMALVGALYVGLAGLVWAKLPPGAAGPGIGHANRVTLARAALAMPILALAVRLEAMEGASAWWVIALSAVVLVLDGVDGRIARRTGTESPFGARFDMEVDALVLMALSALVWAAGRVGGWVLLIGGMRYLFVAAGRVWPALAAELPRSQRRKVVCVVQGVVLLVALVPMIPGWMAVAVCAGGLATLSYSFAVDVLWAARREVSAG